MMYSPEDTVFAVDFRPGHTWIEGRIEERKNNLVWILLKDGRRIRRHLDHVRTRRSCNEDNAAVFVVGGRVASHGPESMRERQNSPWV